ncbi:hypothetical protein JWZ97_06315 [Methylococcus sp. EFPC2]|nr:hypothetical protein JWZ97_06315 [Methylococcus sp. EFPC2]
MEALNYLLGFVGPSRVDLRQFKPDKITAVLKFLAAPKEQGTLYHAGVSNGTPSAYYEVDIARRLDQIIRLTYHPDIPAVFTAPSTVRLAHWEQIDTRDHQLPKLWEPLPEPFSPVFFSGVEHLVNTPDQTTGAYYGYNLYRSVILTRVSGRNLLISLSRQAGTSSVGRRGLVIGSDDRWDYLYTERPGLNRFGLGWVDSYMYDSYSVAFYLENPGGPTVRFGVFKWLRAGWSNINLVRRAHIYGGLQRYGEVFRQIVEHSGVANVAALSKRLLEIRRLPDDRLRGVARDYLEGVRDQAETAGLLSKNEARTVFDERSYLNAMGREAMQSVVVLEYLKQLLGKPHRVDLKPLLPVPSD